MQELMKLPFKKGDLKPFISKKTIKHHYKKHHAGYVKKLNALIHDTPYASMTLEKIVLQSVRLGYLENWWEVIDWDRVSENYGLALAPHPHTYAETCNENSEVCDYMDAMQAAEHVST